MLDQRARHNLLRKKCLILIGKFVKEKKPSATKKQLVLKTFYLMKIEKNILNLIRKIKYAYFPCFIHCAGKEHICCHIHILQALFFPPNLRTSDLNFKLVTVLCSLE